MDAEYAKKRRESEKSRREKRWSMNSQRLEEIVAELMKPISDIRRSFDTDLSALLEEYLTEAGLRALEHDDAGGEVAPNFAELALLLQQSASIYSRKVDCLYQHVLNISDALHYSSQERAAPAGEAAEAQSPAGRRRREAAGGAHAFGALALAACAGARRDGAPRPPPTLPRGYIELEPRVLLDADVQLRDYEGEPIGLMTDYQVTWRLQDGLLVDELQETGAAGRPARGLGALPLVELQAALAAAAPPDPPPEPPPDPPPDPPLDPPPDALADPPHDPDPDGEQLCQMAAPLACSTPQPPPVRERKRRSDLSLLELAGIGKILISDEVRRKLAREQEFAVPGAWVRRVLRARTARVLALRRRLNEEDATVAAGTSDTQLGRLHQPTDEDIAAGFRGFDLSASADIGGFLGWTTLEASNATRALLRRRLDSDDDGFCDQYSSGDSDDCATAALEGAAAWAAWRDAVVARAAAARSACDMRAAGAAVLRAAAALAPRASCQALLAATAQQPADVSHMFLATLFLANAGELEIEVGPPLTLNSFSVRVAAPPPSPPPPPPP